MLSPGITRRLMSRVSEGAGTRDRAREALAALSPRERDVVLRHWVVAVAERIKRFVVWFLLVVLLLFAVSLIVRAVLDPATEDVKTVTN